MNKEKVSKKLGVLIGMLSFGALIFTLQVAKAWTEPSAVAPGGNTVGAPINTGINSQIKTGMITSSSLNSFSFCLPGVAPSGGCISAWPSGGSGLSGTGTTNYISKWTGAAALGNSQIVDDGTNVGIGTTSPAHKLDVNGDISTSGNFTKTGVILGDADGNGVVDFGDVTAIMRYVVGLGGGCTNANCDVDKSGSVDIGDALALLRIVEGIDPPQKLPLESQVVLRSKTQIRGDVNGDMTIDTGDATEILRNVVGLSNTCTPYLCDINSDGKVDIADAQMLLGMVEGTVSTKTLPFESAAIMHVQKPAKPVMGDVDYNGRIDEADAKLILGGSVGLNNCDISVCDINGDGKVDVSDALKLLQYVDGVIPTSTLPSESQALMTRKDSCTWVNGSMGGSAAVCGAGYYVAGVNFTSSQIDCCLR